MPSDDSRGVVWTVPRTWEGLVCSRGAAWGEILDLAVEGGRNDSAVAGGECEGRCPRWSDSPSRQVGVTRPAKDPARGLGGDYPGGDACFGPRRATSTPHGLTTENSAQIPLVGKTSHWSGVVFGVHSYLSLSDHFSQITYFCLRIFLFLFDFIDYIFASFTRFIRHLSPVD